MAKPYDLPTTLHVHSPKTLAFSKPHGTARGVTCGTQNFMATWKWINFGKPLLDTVSLGSTMLLATRFKEPELMN